MASRAGALLRAVVPIGIRRAIKRVLYNEPAMRAAERYLRRYYAWETERRWDSGAHPPEWFDHRADLYLWPVLKRPFWVERGVFSREVMRPGARVLDLCCGDGFFPFAFYSGSAGQIDAVDRDEAAIAHARRWHAAPNITYFRNDVVADPFPAMEY